MLEQHAHMRLEAAIGGEYDDCKIIRFEREDASMFGVTTARRPGFPSAARRAVRSWPVPPRAQRLPARRVCSPGSSTASSPGYTRVRVSRAAT